MKSIEFSLALAASVATASLPAQPITRDGPFEKLALVDATGAKTWTAVESNAEPTKERVKVGNSSWRWHVDVDFFTGEAKYPVGWPRLGHTIPEGALRDWSDWDFLHFWIYVATSRPKLPHDPLGLGLYLPDRAHSFNRPLPEVQKDRWVEINLPIRQLSRPQDVRYFQFNIAEANYQHGDRLDFFLNDLALVRYAEPALFNLTAENTVLFSDAKRLPVRFEVLGIKSGEHANVSCELRRDGRTIARVTGAANRGAQRLVIECGNPSLASGTYEVHAAINGRPQSAFAAVRVVESPWRKP